MNIEWAIAELNESITMTVMRNASGSPGGVSFITSHKYTAAPHSDATKQAQVVEKIFDRVIPGWRTDITNSKNNRWTRHREAAIRAREELVRAEKVWEDLGENAPEHSADELHQWSWSGPESLWQSGPFRGAVEGAINKLNAETQNKVARRDTNEADRFRQAFSVDELKAGKARLRRMNDGRDTYKSVQRGTMALGEGIFVGIRKPLAHEVDHELAEQEALEYLAALSVLARWVDTAEVEAAS